MRNYRPYFVRHLQKEYPAQWQTLCRQTDERFQSMAVDIAFVQQSPNPMDKRLVFSAYFLALIQTLDTHGASYDTIRRVCLSIVTDYVQPKNALHGWIKRLIPKLIGTWMGQKIIYAFQQKVSKNPQPDGFVVRVITDPGSTYGLGFGFDIQQCGICRLFEKHRYSRYAPILCEVDEVTSALAGLRLIRSGTIANGATHCDFRFQRISS